MTTSDNPYSIPASQQRFDPMTVYQESFFALIWPSVAWTVFMLVSSVTLELANHPASPADSPIDEYSLSLLLLLCGLTIPMASYFLTARRLMRHDGKQRSIRRSLMIAISMTFSMIVSGLASLPFAGVVRDMVEANHVNRIAINITVIPAASTSFLAFVFKSCMREIRLTRFVPVSLGSTSIILLVAISHPSMPEITKPVFYTFSASLLSLASHCTCFAWWYATPKLSAIEKLPAIGTGLNQRQATLQKTRE